MRSQQQITGTDQGHSRATSLKEYDFANGAGICEIISYGVVCLYQGLRV